MLSKLQKHKSQTGFTIIEVLIVLAIAGLIMVIVFLAVPNLERSQRNTARKSDASHIASAVADYVSNNNGLLPGTLTTDATTIFNDAGGKSGLSQLGDLIPNTSATITAGDFTVDPTATTWANPGETKDTAVLLVPPTTGATSGWVCSGATPQYTGTPRNAVLMYTVEPGGSGNWTWDCVTAQ